MYYKKNGKFYHSPVLKQTENLEEVRRERGRKKKKHHMVQ